MSAVLVLRDSDKIFSWNQYNDLRTKLSAFRPFSTQCAKKIAYEYLNFVAHVNRTVVVLETTNLGVCNPNLL